MILLEKYFYGVLDRVKAWAIILGLGDDGVFHGILTLRLSSESELRYLSKILSLQSG